MAVTKTVLKTSEAEAVVKIAGTDDSATISLATDVLASSQVALSADHTVNISGITWSGAAGSQIQITRNDVVIATLIGETAAQFDFAGQMMTSDSIENTSDVVITISGGQAECWIRLKKVDGYASKVEYGLYGSYDDETVIGPSTVSGAPAPYGLFDLPLPGSGAYEETIEVDTSVSGTPYPPGGEVTTVDNIANGLYRRKFLGNFAENVGDEINTYFCQDNPSYFGQADTFVGFGDQNLETENNYTIEWTGYFKPLTTGNYNFWAKSDDDLYMWIGPNAISGNESSVNYVVRSSNTTNQTSDSLYLEADKYYPVRLQFGEWQGSEHAQIFWAKEGDDFAWAGNQEEVWFHDSVDTGLLA